MKYTFNLRPVPNATANCSTRSQTLWPDVSRLGAQRNHQRCPARAGTSQGVHESPMGLRRAHRKLPCRSSQHPYKSSVPSSEDSLLNSPSSDKRSSARLLPVYAALKRGMTQSRLLSLCLRRWASSVCCLALLVYGTKRMMAWQQCIAWNQRELAHTLLASSALELVVLGQRSSASNHFITAQQG